MNWITNWKSDLLLASPNFIMAKKVKDALLAKFSSPLEVWRNVDLDASNLVSWPEFQVLIYFFWV